MSEMGTRTTLVSIGLVVAAVVTGLVAAAGPAATAATAGGGTGFADFDGDGFGDLAVGSPFDDSASGRQDAGSVEIRYGDASGISTRHQKWNQSSAGIADIAEESDLFGSTLTWGDFDGDAFTDLAIAAPGEDGTEGEDSGMVHVLYGGGGGGLTGSGSDVFDAEDFGFVDAGGERVGVALTAGHFDGDGFDDLAIGAPGFRGGRGHIVPEAGAVLVLFGSAEGVGAGETMVLREDEPGVPGTGQYFDRFGSALAAGDFGKTAHDDLAIGIPNQEVETDTESFGGAGMVYVIYGSADGLSVVGDQLWHQDSPGVREAAEQSEFFGSALAAGDLGRTGKDDLVIGVPEESLAGTLNRQGVVQVIYGGGNGLAAVGNQVWHQDSRGIRDSAEDGDNLGEVLVVGDFGVSIQKDLAIGIPHEDLSEDATTAGAVAVIYGTPDGLSADGNQFWHQGLATVENAPAQQERFGASLAVGSYGQTSKADLAIGVPGEDIFSPDVGVVTLLFGNRNGLTASNHQLLISQAPAEGDQYGLALG